MKFRLNKIFKADTDENLANKVNQFLLNQKAFLVDLSPYIEKKPGEVETRLIYEIFLKDTEE